MIPKGTWKKLRFLLVRFPSALLFRGLGRAVLGLARVSGSESLARSWFSFGVRVFPEWRSDLAIAMSRHCEALGRSHDAVAFMRKAAEEASNVPVHHLMLAEHFEHLGCTAEAEIEYEVALALHSARPDAGPTWSLSREEQMEAQDRLDELRRDG